MKKISIWLLILLVTLGSLGTGFSTSNGNNFTDVSEAYWASDAIKDLVSAGIMSGYSDGTFGPDKSISREEFAVILVNTFDLKTSTSGDEIFKDVPKTRWSYPYIEGAKDYLTGYFYNNGSKPTFDPTGKAQREDVAVALVKAMGLENEQIDGEDYLEDRFKDVESISPKLRDHVAIAVKYKLMGGFPNKTFKGDATINRASTAQLFYNAMRSPYFKNLNSVSLNVSVAAKTTVASIKYSGTITSDATLMINDVVQPVNNGKFSGTLNLNNGLGSYTFTFKAVGKTGTIKTVTKTVVYEVASPVITLNSIPATTTTETLVVKGKVNKPDGSYPRVFVNDKELTVYSDGSFAASMKLVEGENTITVKAVSTTGLTSNVVKKVVYGVVLPTITFYSAPESSATNQVMFTGKIASVNDKYPKLYINDKYVSLSYYNEFKVALDLKEGTNVFVFKAVDSTGKSSTVTRQVSFISSVPVITLGTVPETTSELQVVIKGTVKDASDRNPKLWINDSAVSVNSNGEFTHTAVLKEGDNSIVFKAQNSVGKVTTLTKTIKMTYGTPVIQITSALESNQPTYQLKGTLVDKSYSPAQDVLTVNGKRVTVNANGEWATDVTLNVGQNTLSVIATNPANKVSSQQVQVSFVPSAPTLNVSAPGTSENAKVQISGNASDLNDDQVIVTVNGAKVTVNSSGNWNSEVTLVDGNNTITVIAQNKYGKTNKIEKIIKYTAPAPVVPPAPAPAA